jgi:hypothetical protein
MLMLYMHIGLVKILKNFGRRGILNSLIKLPRKCIFLTVHLMLISQVNLPIILIKFMIEFINN